MKLVLIFPLLIFSNLCHAQKQRDLVGDYSRIHFMHTIRLSLKDSGRFIVNESTDLFTRRASGTWMLNHATITLTPIDNGSNDSIPPFHATDIIVCKQNELYLFPDRRTVRIIRKRVPKHFILLRKDTHTSGPQ